MSSESQTTSSNPFVVIERLKNNLRQLQQQFPNIKTSEDPVSILEKIPTKLPIINGKPVLVTAFCGPSGAGKSTLFNLLTGLNSPTSDVRRPNSFGSLVAIPKEIFDNPERNDYLPNFKIDYLKSPAELLDENIPKDKIFIEPYDMKYGNKSNWIYIADIPDFNSVAVSNWEKTEQMIQRADSIIFVSTEEGYSDRKTIEYLIKILRISGKVIYLLTRNKSDDIAQQILSKHLIDNIKRVDPSAVSELGKCHFYYSLLSENPKIEDIKPSTLNSNYSFIDEIFSNQNKDTILNSFCYSLKEASNLGEILCNKTSFLIKEEESYKDKIEEQIKKEAEYIVGDEIPLLKILGKIIGEIQIRRYDYIKNQFFNIGNKIKGFFKKNSDNSENIKKEFSKINDNEKIDAEQKRLSESIEKLFDEWLKNEKANSIIDKKVKDEAIRARIRTSYKIILPVKNEGYIDEIIKARLNECLDDGNVKVKTKIANALLAGGTFLFFIDLFVDGAIGTLGMISLAALGGISGSEIVNFLNAIGLRPVLEKIQKEWLEKRREEYFNYLMEYAKNLVLEEIDFKYLKDILEKNNKDIELLKECSPSSFDFGSAGEQND